MEASQILKFGPFRLDTANYILCKNNKLIPIDKTPLRVLIVLAQNAQKQVRNDDLAQKVWLNEQKSIGHNKRIAYHIFILRKAMGDNARNPKYIEVTPKREGIFPGAAKLLLPVECDRPPALAILPFQHFNSDGTTNRLDIDTAQELIDRLGRSGQLLIRPLTAVIEKYQKADGNLQRLSQELAVSEVLTGTVQERSGTTRIMLELVKADTCTVRCSIRADGTSRDDTIMLDTLAEQVLQAFQIEVTPILKQQINKRYTEDREAERFYKIGRYYWERCTLPELQKSIIYFTQAIELDPKYALAHASLADSYILQSLFLFDAVPAHTGMPKALQAAQTALNLDEMLSPAYGSIAIIKTFYEWKWQEAEQYFKQAIKLQANHPHESYTRHWYAKFLAAIGRFEEAIEEITHANYIDPISVPVFGVRAWIYCFMGQPEKAIAPLQEWLDQAPQYPLIYIYTGLPYKFLGDLKKAAHYFEQAVQLTQFQSPSFVGELGHTYAIMGKRAEAHQMLEKLAVLSKYRFVSPFHSAMVYMGLEEYEQAFQLFNEACEQRYAKLIFTKVDPNFSPLQTDPQYQQLLARIGLL